MIRKIFGGVFYVIFCLLTAAVGMEIHGSKFLAVIDFLFAPLAWLKWVIYKEVCLSLIWNAVEFFFK